MSTNKLASAWLPRLLFVSLCFLSCQCAGYHLGGSKPAQMADVKTLYVPSFRNETITPRAQVQMTNDTVDQITLDGTYRIVSQDKADAILRCTIQNIQYNPLRFDREDALSPQELSMEAQISYQVIDSTTQEVLLEGGITSFTNIFVEENFQLSRTAGIPDLSRRAAVNLVSRLTHGL